MPHGRTTETRALTFHVGESLHVNLSLSKLEHDQMLEWLSFVRRAQLNHYNQAER